MIAKKHNYNIGDIVELLPRQKIREIDTKGYPGWDAPMDSMCGLKHTVTDVSEHCVILNHPTYGTYFFHHMWITGAPRKKNSFFPELDEALHSEEFARKFRDTLMRG